MQTAFSCKKKDGVSFEPCPLIEKSGVLILFKGYTGINITELREAAPIEC